MKIRVITFLLLAGVLEAKARTHDPAPAADIEKHWADYFQIRAEIAAVPASAEQKKRDIDARAAAELESLRISLSKAEDALKADCKGGTIPGTDKDGKRGCYPQETPKQGAGK